MYSVVVTSATLPVQPLPALMPNTLNESLPSAFLMALLPQPVSWPAWPSMKAEGMPLSCATRSAVPLRCWTKASRPAGAGVVVAWLVLGVVVWRTPPRLSVDGVPDAAGCTPMACASWRAMVSDSPPGRPDICTESCWSSRSAPRSPWAPSSRPDFMVASRMLLIISRMNSDSNWRAASLVAAGSLCVAPRLSCCSDCRSAASPWLACRGCEEDRERAMLDHLQLRIECTSGLDGLQDGQQVLRRGAQRVERAHHV